MIFEPVSAWEREARCTSGASNHGEECQNDSSVSKHVPARARGEMDVPECSRASLSLKIFHECSAKRAEQAKEAKQDKQASWYVLLCSAICCRWLLCCCRLLVFAASGDCMLVFIAVPLPVLFQERQDSQASQASQANQARPRKIVATVC